MKRKREKDHKSQKSRVVFLCCIIVCVLILGVILSLVVNGHVTSSTGSAILSREEVSSLEDVSCILVLGCLVRDDGEPGGMLEDRLEVGIALYRDGVAPKLLMSGDHGSESYDEVNAMKQYALEKGVDSSDVFMDHAGFSTYDSLYRAREVFGAEKIVIVTQEYHLYRALYIAESLGIEAYGVASDLHAYAGQEERDIREFLARNKDFVGCALGVKPKFLGEKIPLDGDGDLTND